MSFRFSLYQKNIILLILAMLLIGRLQAEDSIRNNSKYYFCNGRIFDPDIKLRTTDLNSICEKITRDDRFLVTVQSNINTYNMESDSYYTRDTEEFFLSRCSQSNTFMCDYGFMISIYTQARKVRITAGRVSKNIVTVDKRDNVIYAIKPLLSNERYGEAIVKAIDIMQSYNSYSPQSTTKQATTVRVEEPVRRSTSSSGGISFFGILLFVICPCFCLCALIYYCVMKQPDNQEVIYSNEDVHNHLSELELMLREVRRNNPSIISTDTCLICMQKIYSSHTFNNRPFEMENINQSTHFHTTQNDMQNTLIPPQDPNLVRYGCGHLYHRNCLSRHNLSMCLMCMNSHYESANQTVINTNCFHILDENNIKSFMQHIHLIYGKERLQEYARVYPNEFDSYNTALGLGLIGVWGITTIATTAIIADSMYSHHNYYDNQGGYNQGYDQGYNSGYNQAQNPTYTNSNYDNNYEPSGGLDTAEGDY